MSFPIAVLASGNGTNLQAIIDRFLDRSAGVEVRCVISNKEGARAIERARNAGIAAEVFERKDFPDRETRDQAIGDALEERGVELVVLAGYMALLSPALVRRFQGRIINVHPALLPSFPGLDAIGQARDYGVKVTGVTVHFVDEGVDTGPIILQEAVPLTYTRDAGEVEDEIHRIEHQIFPRAIELIAKGRVRIDPENPRVVIVDDPA